MSFKSLSIVAAAAMVLCAGAAQAQNRLANGGFEDGQTTTPGAMGVPTPNVDPTKAQAWIPEQNGYSRSGDARSGSFAASIRQTAPDQAAIMLQNSIATGGLPSLTVGDSLSLSFWAKATVPDMVSFYNFSYALRYLNDNGNILGGSGVQQFGNSINTNTYSQITSGPFVVPVGATAAFLEFSVAGGGRLASVLIDDVSLVPEPESYALMLAGLGVVGTIVHRRRRSA